MPEINALNFQPHVFLFCMWEKSIDMFLSEIRKQCVTVLYCMLDSFDEKALIVTKFWIKVAMKVRVN